MAKSTVLFLVALFIGFGLAGSAAVTCPSDVSFCGVGAANADKNGCCTNFNPDCCNRNGERKFCHIDETDSPCCANGTTPCNFDIATCVPNKQLCGGKCCGGAANGVGLCCGGKTCCQYSTSKCTSGLCAATCVRKANNKTITTFCPEPKFCCKGYCIDRVIGIPTLPCKGRCCDIPDAGTNPFLERLNKGKNGVCCNGTCCNGNNACCTNPLTGKKACGLPCGSGKCCFGGTQCCNGKCVDANTYCDGNCCTGAKAGSCCGNQCCPKPSVCCGNPFPGTFFFGTCCKKCCGDNCCP